jgi:predicted metal-dependent HD superfamily phosphohydrolase
LIRISDAWSAAVRQLGGRVDPGVGTDLERRWAEPHRHYHGTAHLEAVLRDVSRLADEVQLDAHERAVVTIAACAHDVVYDARPGADERASAEWVRGALASCAVASQVIDRVAALVLATIDHAVGVGDQAGAVLMDADLAVLAAAPPEYGDYVAGVRAEYARLPDDQWRPGRARVLSGLLERDRLYLTDPARSWWEEPARGNLAAELSRLTRR